MVPKATCAGPLLRGPVALPGSEATSRKKGARRNLGDLLPPAVAKAPGQAGKLDERSRSGR